MAKKPPENATLIERLTFYVEHDQEDKAKALALLADHLEECFLWDIQWDAPID